MKTTLTHVLKPSLLAMAASTFILTGCGTVTPQPFNQDEIAKRVDADRKQMYADQEPITAPITFEQAAARALKYNLDYKLKAFESSLASGLLDVASYEMLPKVVAGAGYHWRSNYSGGTSIGIDPNQPNYLQQTLSPSSSMEKEFATSNLTFSWSVLDFGVSYYRAQQKADQVLMAEERRRKVVQNIMQDVRNSYWRAVGAQKLIKRVDSLLSRVNTALAKSKEVEQQGLMPKPQVLGYQRALLDAVNLLTLRRQDLELARAELSALMSIKPGEQYTLADESEQSVPSVPKNIDALETLALKNRPEIMEEWYRKRVTENDIKAARLLIFPNLSFDTGLQYDSNKYAYNNDWAEAGLRLSWNIMKLAQLPAVERSLELQNKTDDMRRMSLSMAVLTQVRIAVQRYALSLSELNYAKESLHVDQNLLKFSQSAAQTQFDSELEVIRAEARALLSEYQRYVSYSNAQAAWGRIYNSIGLDVLPDALEANDVQTVANTIKETTKHWQNTVFE